MAKRRAEERRMAEMVELGRRNAGLVPEVEGWCQHLRVRQQSAGLLARVYDLPIGMLSIECEHARRGGFQAMQLVDVATSFIERNCLDCQLRRPLLIRSFGTRLLEEKQRFEQEQRQREAQRGEALERVRRQVGDALPGIIPSRPVTEQSVLQLIVALEDGETKGEAAHALPEAANVAPELFSHDAILALSEYLVDDEHGATAAKTLDALSERRISLPSAVPAAIERALRHGGHSREISALAATLAETGQLASIIPLLPLMVSRLFGYSPIVGMPRHENGVVAALRRIARLAPREVAAHLAERLTVCDKHARIGTSEAIRGVILVVPEVGPLVAPALLASLSLDDDPFGKSADSAACAALAAIYVLAPDVTEAAMDAAYEHADDEVRGLIAGIYDAVIRAVPWRGGDTAPESGEAAAVRAAKRALLLLSTADTPAEVLTEAGDALKALGRRLPHVGAGLLDQTLGALALACQWRARAETSAEGDLAVSEPDRMMAALQKQSELAARDGSITRITEAIRSVAASCAPQVHARTAELIAQLDSSRDGRYKALLVGLYGTLGRRPELLPAIVPALFRHLMDFDSPLVRGSALAAVEALLSHGVELPSNMLDLVPAFLTDTYVYVHKWAVRVAQVMRPSGPLQAVEVLQGLLTVSATYRQEDPYYAGEALDAALHVAARFPGVYQWVVENAVTPFVENAPPMAAEKMLLSWMYGVDHAPATMALFAASVLRFLRRTPRDPYDSEYGPRIRLHEKLLSLPRDSLCPLVPQIEAAAFDALREDPWGAVQFIEILSHLEEHERAGELASRLAEALPMTERHGRPRARYALWSAAERTEALVAQHRAADSIALAESAASAGREDDEAIPEMSDVSRILDLARRLAQDSQ